MATITIHFDSAGNPTPATITIQIGDTVVFHAGAQPIVLCIDPESIFGAERYALPAGASTSLSVLAGASGDFSFTSLAGDIEAECGARGATGGDGSGKVGGQ
ncbi:MAG: hypothetical protein SH809_05000 [Rhodothermales bacterium]|nr:hypothetical protein [Rhodothermales bacterium]